MVSNLKLKALLITTIFSLVFAPMSITSASTTTNPKLDQTPGVINILTRHEAAIQEAFAEGFLNSQLAQDLGYSTGDKNKIVFWEVGTTQGWIKALERTGETAMDLAWGGGPPLFDDMASADYFSTVDAVDSTLATRIDSAVPDEIAGVDMKRITTEDEMMWIANVISSFGFTVNRGVLETYGLDFPTKWIDLASPDFFIDEEISVISLGNPPETTSNSRIYQIILQVYGWDRGWEIITAMAGNGGIFGGSLGTRAAVADAQVAVGMTIDFYGVHTVNSCAESDRCEYIIPEDGSIINGDPIAFVKNRNNEPAAKAFFEYVFTEEGQALWIANDRLPIDGGAFNTTLGLTRPDVKALYDATLLNQGFDFDDDLDLATIESMKEYFESSITDVHDELKAAWSKIVTEFKDGVTTQAEFDLAVTELAKPQITLQEAKDINDQIKTDSEFRYNTKLDWSAVAGDRYNEIAGVNDDDAPLPMIPVILSLLATMIVTSILRKKRT